ncbi:hypothetical protein A6J66_000830 [Yersinia enterocolitica]|nr:hypothetical protein A6J66_000830 [Yersinia enterocolitica]
MPMCFIDHFSTLDDPRRNINVKYDFLDIIFLTVCAVVSGAAGWKDIKDFGDENDTIINSGGQMDVVGSRSVANGTTINSGGLMEVRGGTVNNTTVNDDGVLLVNGVSGLLTGQTVVNGTGDIQFYGDTAEALQNQGELVFQRSNTTVNSHSN